MLANIQQYEKQILNVTFETQGEENVGKEAKLLNWTITNFTPFNL